MKSIDISESSQVIRCGAILRVDISLRIEGNSPPAFLHGAFMNPATPDAAVSSQVA